MMMMYLKGSITFIACLTDEPMTKKISKFVFPLVANRDRTDSILNTSNILDILTNENHIMKKFFEVNLKRS